MIKLKDLLLEKTFNIGADINYIYKVGGFGEFLKKFNKNTHDFPHMGDIQNENDVLFNRIDSKELKSSDATIANLANSVNIFCGIYKDGSYYMPTKKRIQLSFNYNVLSVFANGAEEGVPSRQIKVFENELTEHRIKSTISHELSHWISDSLYNSHIGKIIQKATELSNGDILTLGEKTVDMTYFEIDAQIHGIKELKRKFKSQWDSFTLYDVFQKYPSLWGVAKVIYNNYKQDVLNLWQKMLVKRMSREGLLGKNMIKFVDGSSL